MRIAPLCALVLTSVVLVSQQAPPGRQPARGKSAAPESPALGEGACTTIANASTTAESWSLQALALLSLGDDWHPVGSAAVAAALQCKEPRLPPYGLEQLRRTSDRVFASVCTKAVVETLVTRFAGHKNALLKERALELLHRALPTVTAKDAAGWQRWWRDNEATYAPPAWTPRDQKDTKQSGTVTMAVVEKAFDLRDSGLQVAFVVDSTGSMQMAIDAVRDAVGDIASILGGIAPKLELGLVHYKDFGDMSEGADLLVPMTKDQKKVVEKLAHLTAGGGGDVPEAVQKGIEVALGKEMGWKKEANRMLLVVGDAPPHPEDQTALIELVKAAHEKPFADPKHPTTGKEEELHPFVTSTIATNKQANPWFQEIADAGGGTMVLLDVGASKRRDSNKDAAKRALSAPQTLAKHVLRLSFGAQFESQIDRFVDVFFEYRQAGAY